VALRIEDYAVIGDTGTAGLVGCDGSLDWLCFPRFDSGACFAALLGGPENGRWQIAPVGEVTATRRRYRDGTLILETEMDTGGGSVRLIDFMPVRDEAPDVVRIVEGVTGTVPMRMELIMRYDYGWIVPWVHRIDGALSAVAGPDALLLRSPVRTRGVAMTTVAEFSVSPGDRAPFVLSWYPSFREPPHPIDAEGALTDTEQWWRDWSDQSTCRGEWAEPVNRSLITLKALTFAPTGGIVAAPTTSLPEKLGGIRNWDYRYCWLRDATFTLWALLLAGFREEAAAWRDWLLRATAGSPDQAQIMYGLGGERHLLEWEVDWLPGFGASAPVRIGNAAHAQFQLDVYGEVLDALHQGRVGGIAETEEAWQLQRALATHVEKVWQTPDQSLWEMRGPAQHFTHSKVMAWVAIDRAIKGAEQFKLEGPLDRWRALRQRIHGEICARAYDAHQRSFVQAYGSPHVDASLLLLPLVGFLPASDARIQGTIARIEQRLVVDGFVLRYDSALTDDGLPAGEGAFLACSFWLADAYVLLGRHDDARTLFERLVSLRNDVGLLSEEYDPAERRFLGNFPQAFSHVALVTTGLNLDREHDGKAHPATQRAQGTAPAGR
jgi:GH15 family glucan-1,4-alpha-glucosidase